MFTGIVEGTGIIQSRESRDTSTRLVVDAGNIANGASQGESIAINGCCLTVVEVSGSYVSFDLLNETLQRTNLKSVVKGSLVNLERALKADGRMGGHFVSGHVDDTGKILRWEKVGKDFELEVQINKEQARWLIAKGSVAIDGISLTVGEVKGDRFNVWIIPHTRAITALQERKAGDEVNLEFDLVAKYIERLMECRLPGTTAAV